MASYIFSIASNPSLGEISYTDGVKNYFFKVDFKKDPVKLYMDRYFSGPVAGLSYKLSEIDRARIASELIKKLEDKGYSVEVIA